MCLNNYPSSGLSDEPHHRALVFVGGLSFPVDQVLAQGDMFLNSSVSEGLPLAIIEASRAGLVVVATDVGGKKQGGTPVAEYLRRATKCPA